MKKLLLLTFAIASFAVTTQAQQPNIGPTGLGNLQLGFSVDSVNKYLGTKVKLILPPKDDYRWDTVEVSYKGVKAKLLFYQYFNDDDKKYISELFSIYTEHPGVSTEGGIRAGRDKFEVIKQLDGNLLTVRPEPEFGDNVSTVVLRDYESGNDLVLYFRDNVLYAIESRIGG